MLELQNIDNLKVLKSEKMNAVSWLEHGFTTRIGGISDGPFSSLNLYSNLPEEQSKFIENRKILAKSLDFNYENLVLAQQVHGKRVQIVRESEIGQGALNHKDAIPETDALVTNLAGVPLMLLYADCLPILIADTKNKAVGVVHAGWKGTAQNILVETLNTMIKEYNSQKEDLLVAIGIGISKKNFEIGADTRDKLSEVSFSSECFEEYQGKIYADLVEINISQLLNFGISENNIDYNKSLCTYSNDDLFYSYRRDNKITGRHSAVILIK